MSRGSFHRRRPRFRRSARSSVGLGLGLGVGGCRRGASAAAGAGGQRAPWREHACVLVAQDVVGVQLGALDELHLAQVEEALDRVDVVAVDDDERLALDAERRQRGLGRLGLRGVEAPVVDDDDLALGGAVRQRRAQRELDHLLRGLLVVLARLRAEGDATTAEVRCAGRALAGVAGALLLERLLPPPRTSARVLVLCVPARRAASWAVTTWCMHRHVGLDAEHVVVELDACRRPCRRRS